MHAFDQIVPIQPDTQGAEASLFMNVNAIELVTAKVKRMVFCVHSSHGGAPPRLYAWLQSLPKIDKRRLCSPNQGHI
jgi:hypothetical protein